jgi:hypothetical protein
MSDNGHIGMQHDALALFSPGIIFSHFSSRIYAIDGPARRASHGSIQGRIAESFAGAALSVQPE